MSETEQDRRAAFLREASSAIRNEWTGDRGSGWTQVQAYHLAMADWLDGEALTVGGFEPLVDLLNAAYENESGVVGYLKFQRDNEGRIKFLADTSPASTRFAAAYLGRDYTPTQAHATTEAEGDADE